ncbi:unnamed protein product [Acanthoscelides obtectus]|uniref:Uncharacterized protein n=1 Tax=Acanthoscelides obtectus TaxID=200917 RepID=A0A9P0Q524_ACAOB|nr:unnamed protein product [Acanthoscelides obtectus]CAK1646257.1 hypothetical protein AOBTE_LOCUS14535 [Acanthoscelides obtectus]
MLLVTVLTAQALQLAGIIETPKGLHELTYQQEHEYNFQVAVGEASSREKRETGERSKLIDSFFNKQFGQGEFFFRIDRTKVIFAVM